VVKVLVFFYLPTPVNATLVSNNFQHILRWSPGRDTPPQTAYRVKRRYCISSTIEEHKDNMKKPKVTLKKYIFANFLESISSSEEAPRIQFLHNSTIGPPSVDVLGCGDCLNITILLWKGDGIKGNDSDIYYNQIRFILHWKKATDEKVKTDGMKCYVPLCLFYITGLSLLKMKQVAGRHKLHTNCNYTQDKMLDVLYPAIRASIKGPSHLFLTSNHNISIFFLACCHSTFCECVNK
uniref:Fibronectin type-III domain-containing protein n=1 Tax=Electrophorus electricus TaxID=8005 RepID=A0A4W4DVY6_ELEEL